MSKIEHDDRQYINRVVKDLDDDLSCFFPIDNPNAWFINDELHYHYFIDDPDELYNR